MMIQEKVCTLRCRILAAFGWRKLAVMLLFFCLCGCDVNSALEKNIVGVWEGSKGNRSWCVEFSEGGELKMARARTRDKDKHLSLNEALALNAGLQIEGVEYYSGTWMLGKGKRLIAKMGSVESETAEGNNTTPRLFENMYFIKKLESDVFIYSDTSYENTFENIRVETCSEKFDEVR